MLSMQYERWVENIQTKYPEAEFMDKDFIIWCHSNAPDIFELDDKFQRLCYKSWRCGRELGIGDSLRATFFGKVTKFFK